MRAVYIEAHGGPDKLIHGERPDPDPGPGEVLVQLQFVGLNHLDCWVRKGIPGLKFAPPHILGADGAGTVISVGPGVKKYQVGDKVILQPGIGCGYCFNCLSGRANRCHEYAIRGENRPGVYCQRVATREEHLVPLPSKLSIEAGAAIALTFLTAWQMAVKKGGVGPGQWVLVLAGASGVGVALIQICRLFGANVIACAGSEEKLKLCQSLGAVEVINYSTGDFSKRVREITGKKGVDLVLEQTGMVTFESSLKSVRWGGRIVLCGATSGPMVTLDLRQIFFKQLEILGSTMGSPANLLEFLPFFERGDLKPVIGEIFPLEKAREAHERMENKETRGKILLQIP